MDEYKSFSDTSNRWTAVTDLTVFESQARAQARIFRDQYIAAALVKLGRKVASYVQAHCILPFGARGAQ